MSTPNLLYHNNFHLDSIYDTAKKWGLPYDINLDAAILFHDSVYDAAPYKERRSADFMRELFKSNPKWFAGIDVDKVDSLIMTTVNHRIEEDTDARMIRLDLAALADLEQVYTNFWHIAKESQYLYGIDIQTACQGTVDFMDKFMSTVAHNRDTDSPGEFEFWGDVLIGCTASRGAAKTVVDLCAQVLA